MNLTADDLLFAGAVAAFVSAICFAKRFSGPPMALRRWAEEQGYVIVRAKYREYVTGPFEKIGFREQQAVFQGIFRTPDGTTRHAWVRCNYAPGNERVDVVWDAPAGVPAAEGHQAHL